MRDLDPAALEAVLPHRGVNLIPDVVTIHAPDLSTSRTLIPAADPRGRMLMSRQGAAGPYFYEPFLGELLALTGVPLLHERLSPQGQTAVFSMISRLEMPAAAPLHEEILGEARITRDRGGFTVFTTSARSGGRTILTAEVMSGAAVLAQMAGSPVQPLADRLGEPVDPGLFAWKPAPLRFIDTIIEADPAARRIVCSYEYPADHPFVPGHFPELPVMMGVTQWAAVADAGWAARHRFGITGPVTVSAVIRRPDGTDVADVRDLVLEPDGDGCRMAGMKRIAFRGLVRPGDGLIIDATLGA
ncbi:MAG: FabA-like domain [Planctomycetota bacterium]|jgi:3-hydroxymyristoyl/3-hydroxydecanoyl-(acyl carrier protein) dehydratase